MDDQNKRKEEEKKLIEKKSKNADVSTATSQFLHHFQAKNQVKISKYEYSLAADEAKAGDYMRSGIIRLKYEYSDEKYTRSNSVILKAPSLAALPYDVLKMTNMIDREVHFYTTLLPDLYRLGKCQPFAPVLYTATEAGALVLEDLEVKGYKSGDRIEQLGINEAIATLDVLAQYHALGYKYLQTLSEDDPTKSLIGPDQSVPMALMGRTEKANFENFCEMVETKLSEPLYDRILELENEILADPVIKSHPGETSITVIMHANCQTNNILFKYDEDKIGAVSDTKLIDWQFSRVGHPIVDLIYFFVTSVRIDVFKHNDQTLWYHYIHELEKQLKLLEDPLHYSATDLENNLKHYKYYYLNVLITYWQEIMGAGPPGKVTDLYISRAVEWLKYLEEKKII